MKYLLLTVFLLSGLCGYADNLPDSTGIEEVNGKKFIIHRVEEKETLYSLSRKYNVPIYRIIEHNPPIEFGLEVGNTIRVPLITEEITRRTDTDVIKDPSEITQRDKSLFKKHFVEEKQTLYAISKLYNVSIEQIKVWNNLSDNALEIGQELLIKNAGPAVVPDTVIPLPDADNIHIVQPSETLYSLSRKYNVSVETLKQWNELITNDISIGQQLIIADHQSTPLAVERQVDAMPDTSNAQPLEPLMEDREPIDKALEAARKYEEENEPVNFEEILEAGLAEVIEGTDDTRKYLALHRTAKVGTILRVRNDMNDQEVFVRVLGKLPDTGANQKVLIKLSKSAYNRLGAIDPRFRVTVTYIP